ISFPLLGRIKVAGFSIQEVERIITELLKKDYLVNPQVNVLVRQYSSIYVFGQVEKPGAYPLAGRLTVVEAIALAGGFTKIAAKNKVKVIERGGQEVTINVDAFVNKGKGDDRVLAPGDIIVVPESFF
ncbi:polysaccharide biosynthesis/export family protein, partial [Chlamydiota bacterium]